MFGRKEKKMPIIRITMLEGRENELIEQCMRDIAHTVQKSLDIPLESIRVIVDEVPKNRFSVGNRLKSEV
jgi:4-oxalocrotonate tautomerase